MPLFFIGVMFCDLEHDKAIRRLDALRDLPWYFKIPINTGLLILFCFYGSVWEEENSRLKSDVYRSYEKNATNDYMIGFPTCMLISSVSIFMLALISQWFQWILASAPFQFLGKISYTLYLIHDLFIEWAQYDTKVAFEESGVEA